ncbi:hypothetical protein [Actinomadura geliboluensis]|uniref:hypothetical protein n=1 Tax=Actinomadura geliboluensis TaxID=882440 RepID=UPI00371EF7DC
MDLSPITREAVLDAMAECDHIGRDRFLERYGFERARRYFLHHDGVHYDSKAIVGVAYRHVAGRPLAADEFSGGQQTVARLLKRLDFKMVTDEPPLPQQRLLDLLGTLRVANTPRRPRSASAHNPALGSGAGCPPPSADGLLARCPS